MADAALEIEFPVEDDVNTWFLLASGYLVFFMQCGFAMLCAGSVRAKNAKNIILLNLLDACFGCIVWYILGFAFAYGDPLDGESVTGSQAFIGNRFFCLSGYPQSSFAFWFFQFTFAATAATIVSGAVAERCRFETYIAYEVMLVGFVYPVVAHWVWSPYGWLSSFRSEDTSANQSYVLLFGTGAYDFAGDGPVHMLGGFASLVAAWILGPRMGRFDANGDPVDMPGHNASLTILGVFLLWFGWYGFNPGSTLLITGGVSSITALVAINTTLGAASGAISTLFVTLAYEHYKNGVMVYDLLLCGNGALGGLVSITGGACFVYPWAAIIIGFIGGIVYFISSKVNLHVLKVDDPLDAVAVHAGCGVWGLIAISAFAAPRLTSEYFASEGRAYGFIMGGGSGGGKLLACQLLYIVMVALWTCAIMIPYFLLLKKIGIFRVSPEVEAQGLDVSHHGGSAYPYTKSTDKAEYAKQTDGLTEKEIDMKIEDAITRLRTDLKVE